MKKNKFDEDTIIHKTYKKSRVYIFILFLFVICFMSIGNASFSSVFEIFGVASLTGEEGNLEITNIELVDGSINATSNGTNFYINQTDEDSTTLVAEFDINFYRTMGSANSLIKYNVTIKNNTYSQKMLSSLSSTPNFTSGTSTLNYEVDGASVGTTILYPGEEVVVTLSFSITEFERNTDYAIYETFNFTFGGSITDSFRLKLGLNTTEVEFDSVDSLVPITVTVLNLSSFEGVYNFSTNNKNFSIVDSSASELEDFTILGNASEIVTFYLKINDDCIFSSTTDSLDIILNTLSPVILNYDVGDISATVPLIGIQNILNGKTILSDSTIDFTSSSITSGLYSNTADDITYFYRGNVDNYVSFAGLTWRIIKMDRNGVRVVLNSTISTTSEWGDNPGQSADLSTVLSVIDYANSPVKTAVDNWYNNTLSSYSDVIKPSEFCIDKSYRTMTSSGNAGVSVYYFGSYIRNGKDSAGYTPQFNCSSEYIQTYNVGIMSGDEIAFAGGLFNESNTSYYLYNSSITEHWWSLSPSYYDSSLGSVGMLLVTGSTGSFNDWFSTNTIEESISIRPVITIDASKFTGGSGTSGSPYTFSS